MKTTSNKPIHKIRIGTVEASIWVNQAPSKGFVNYNATFQRFYRDGEKWKYSETFGRDDLLVLAKVADQCHTWIWKTIHATPSESEADASSRNRVETSGSKHQL